MMSSLRSVEAKLPPGFRFHPRDEELICDYLMKWVVGCAHPPLPSLIQVDLNKCEPWDIPETACVGGKDWYFYSQRDRKYSTGLRTNRATVSGYWKATGKDRPVIRKGNLVGMRKTLVFYQGRAPKGKKTDWVMHEYRLEGTQGPGPKTTSSVQEDWVLCRVFFKNTSEIPAKLEETTPSSPSIPMIEPYNNNNNDNNNNNNNITILDHQTQAAGCSNDHHLYNEQVPCFSILNTNQTSPTFSLLTVHMDFPDVINTPHCHLGMNNYSNDYSPSLINNHDYPCSPSTSCDEKALRDVLNHLTKMESANDNSPSFGEGSSDSYLSEVGLCSMWNQYS